MTTHFKAGVTNVPRYDQMGLLREPDASQYHQYYDDFDYFISGNWVVTKTQVGATQVIASGDGGLLTLVNTAANNDLDAIQWAGGAGSVVTNFNFDPLFDFVLQARFKVDDATNAAAMIGITVADTSPIASLPSDGIWFYKAAGGTTLVGSMTKSSTSTSQTLTTAIDTNFHVAALTYNSLGGKWSVWYDNNLVGESTVLTNAPATSTGLALQIAVQNGTAAARTLTVDYVNVMKARTSSAWS